MAERVSFSFGKSHFSTQKALIILQYEFNEALKIAQKKGLQPVPHQQAKRSARKVYNVLKYGIPNPSLWDKWLSRFF